MLKTARFLVALFRLRDVYRRPQTDKVCDIGMSFLPLLNVAHPRACTYRSRSSRMTSYSSRDAADLSSFKSRVPGRQTFFKVQHRAWWSSMQGNNILGSSKQQQSRSEANIQTWYNLIITLVVPQLRQVCQTSINVARALQGPWCVNLRYLTFSLSVQNFS